MNRYRLTYGFTLLELIVVVAIIGILAAVAIPVYRGYVTRSRASEVYSVLQGIRDREEGYFSEYKRYTDDMPDGQYTPGGCVHRTVTVNWQGDANINYWIELGFVPDGPTWYSYHVDSSYQDGDFTGAAPPANRGTTWPAGFNRPWFMAEACGDLDGNGVNGRFFISSLNKNVFHNNDTEY